MGQQVKQNLPSAVRTADTFVAKNSLQITWQKMAFSVVDLGETDQILTVSVDCTPLYDSTNGVISAVAKCNVDQICQ